MSLMQIQMKTPSVGTTPIGCPFGSPLHDGMSKRIDGGVRINT